jgi:hypothetical protein
MWTRAAPAPRLAEDGREGAVLLDGRLDLCGAGLLHALVKLLQLRHVWPCGRLAMKGGKGRLCPRRARAGWLPQALPE